MVATRAMSAVRLSLSAAQPAFDRLDPERLLKNAPVVVDFISAAAAPEKAQFERGGLIEHDDASMPVRSVVPQTTNRLVGGKMIYMRKRA